jgi:hypothetical protein
MQQLHRALAPEPATKAQTDDCPWARLEDCDALLTKA